jgi:prepilin peptidase CpaA
MNGTSLSLTLLALLAVLLVACAIEDMRQRTIANWKNAVIALLAPLWWWSQGWALWPDLALHVGVAVGVFALFVGIFALGQMGGGDVKLIGAMALWLPPVPLMQLLMLMAIVGAAITIVAAIEHRWRRRPGRTETPYGVAIAVAGLIMLREPLFYQFTG